MEPIFIFIPIGFIVFFTCIYLAKKAFPEDTVPAIVFSLLPMVIITLYTVLVLFKPYLDNCRTITQIGGCNRYDCGVLTDRNTKESVSEPVLGQKLCDTKFEFRWM
jgi:hypothetical protein